jgi:hypothetical protein
VLRFFWEKFADCNTTATDPATIRAMFETPDIIEIAKWAVFFVVMIGLVVARVILDRGY